MRTVSLNFILIIGMAGFSQAMNLAEFTDRLRYQMAREFKLPVEDLELEILHPEQLPLEQYTHNYQIQWGIEPLKPGLRKVWLISQPPQQRLSRRPCYLRIALWQEVVVAATDIKVKDVLSADKVNLKRVLLTNAQDGYFTTKQQVEQKMSKQNIATGEVITPQMLKAVPDVMMGAKVQVKITYGNIVIETEGRINQEARVGEPVTVVCDFMRRKLSGILSSPEMVQVQIR